MRFSIKGLLAAVTAVALGCAALLNANDVWAGVVYVAAFLLLCMGILGTALRRGRHRAFWIGFTVFGWAYVVMIGGNPTGTWARRTPADGLLENIHEAVATTERRPFSREEGAALGLRMSNTPMRTIYTPDKTDFKKVGHSLFLLLLGYVGGLLGVYFHAKDKQDR